MNKTIGNRATGLEIVEVNHERFAVEITNGNLSVNLTQMAKPFGKAKRPSNWIRSEESKTYLEALSKSQKRDLDDLLTVRYGSWMPGTWCHDYRIAMRFAQWLNPAFSIQVDTLLVKLLTKQAVVAEPVNGVWPIIKDGIVGYPRKELLVESGYSYRSGNVQRMKERYGSEHFFQIYRTACISPKMADFIKRRGEVRQLEINFSPSL